MAWSDNKFSDQYTKARATLTAGGFPDSVKDNVAALKRVMTESGFESAAATALDDVRAKFTNVTAGETPGTQQDDRILAAAGYSGGATGAIDAATRERAAMLKFARHMYLLKERGGQKVWIHSLPNDFNDWPHWALATGGADAARTLLRSTAERFTDDAKKNLSAAMLDGLRWCQKTIEVLVAYVGSGAARAAAEPMIKRWFADENSDAKQLGAHVADLTSGFKAIQSAINRNQIVLTDFPTLRSAVSGKTKGLRMSEAFVWGKAHREKLDVIYIEDAFFGANNTMTGKTNWTRILIHELSHLIYGTADVEPGPRYSWYGIAPNAAGFSSAQAVTNADNWAFFAADCAGALTDAERTKALKVK